MTEKPTDPPDIERLMASVRWIMGESSKSFPADVMQRRQDGADRLAALLDAQRDFSKVSERPEYLVQETTYLAIDDAHPQAVRLVQPWDCSGRKLTRRSILFGGTPNAALKPNNAAAEAIFKAWQDSLYTGQEPVRLVAPSGSAPVRRSFTSGGVMLTDGNRINHRRWYSRVLRPTRLRDLYRHPTSVAERQEIRRKKRAQWLTRQRKRWLGWLR